jgi:hypothetical protein
VVVAVLPIAEGTQAQARVIALVPEKQEEEVPVEEEEEEEEEGIPQ